MFKPYFFIMLMQKESTFDVLPSSGKTLALAVPEARLYNHFRTDIRPLLRSRGRISAANVCIGYISAISQRNELKFCMIVI